MFRNARSNLCGRLDVRHFEACACVRVCARVRERVRVRVHVHVNVRVCACAHSFFGHWLRLKGDGWFMEKKASYMRSKRVVNKLSK